MVLPCQMSNSLMTLYTIIQQVKSIIYFVDIKDVINSHEQLP